MSPKFTSKLQGQRTLILGGTSGIGFAVAEASLEYGATVVISGSKQAKLDAKLKELQQSYPDVKDHILGKTCDLSNLQTQESNIVALLEYATESKTKNLDHIINTTGDGLHNPKFSELTIEKIHDSQTVRIVAPLMLAKHAETYLTVSPSSSLIFTSGSGIYKPSPGWTLMSVIGMALDGLIRALAINIAPIRVNGVAPGAILTELWGGGQKVPDEKARTIAEGFEGRVLTGKIGMPEDVAEAYLYLMRDTNVTGQMKVSDGGSLLK